MHKDPAGEEADGACKWYPLAETVPTEGHIEKKEETLTSQNEHQQPQKHWIAQIQHCPRQCRKTDPTSPENQGVQTDISTRHTRSEETPPLPPVVLGTEQEVDQEDCRSGGGEEHQEETDEEEAEHVVNLAGPDGCHNEEELDENGCEGEEAGD